MEELKIIASQLVAIGVLIYALLMVAGAPFVGPKWANGYAKWIIGLPFRMIGRLIFRKKKKKKSRKKRR